MPFVVALSAAVALLLVPGGLISIAMGVRGLWLAAITAPLSIAVVGGTGVAVALLGIPFAFWQPTVVAAGLALAAAATRRWLRPRGLWFDLGGGDRVAWMVWVALGISAAIVATIFVALVGGPGNVSQSYDGVFHLNAVAWILETGDASSFHLYRMTHPGDDVEFYPAAWHALVASVVQLGGPAIGTAQIAVATNSVWLASTWLVWLPGAAVFTRVMLGRGRGVPSEAVAVMFAAVATAVPWTLLGWGTLYPTGLATALLPSGLAIAVVLLGRRGRDRFVPVIALAAFWAIAELFAHPRAMASFVLLVAPLVVAAFIRWTRRAWTAPGGPRRVIATASAIVTVSVGALVAGIVYVYRNFDVANRPISDHLNGGPATATQGLFTSLLQAVGLAVPPPDGIGTAFPQIALAGLTLIGVLVAVRSRRMRWLVAAWGLSVILYAAAAGSNSDLAKVLTGVWYKDKFRLFVMLAVAAIPLSALGVRALSGLLPRRARVIGTAILTVAVTVATALGPGSAALDRSIHRIFTPQEGGFMGPSDYTLMGDMRDLVPDDAVIIGNPWDGSTLTWAIGGRRSLFPHLVGEWTADEITIAQRLDEAGTDPEVCGAVLRSGARYVYHSDGLLWGDPAEAAFFGGIDRAVADGTLMTEIAREGSSVLYRLDSCDG